MKKRVFRFYWLLLTSQERWLNQMSDEGYRLLKTTTAHYEFEECEKGKYRYRVEYIANLSKEGAGEYVKALKDCGYRVLFKNLNMDYSAGKVEYRPWAEEGGQIATEKTTLHKELLIIEKENDGKAFELCTSFEKRYHSYSKLRMWGVAGVLVAALPGIVGKSIVWGVLAVLPLAWTILFHLEIERLKKDEREKESGEVL